MSPPLPMVRSKHLVPLPPSLVGEKCGRFWCHINFSVADSAPRCFAGPASTRADRGNGEWLLSLFPSFSSASLRNSASWKSTQSQFSWQSHRWNPPGHSWSCHVGIPPPKSPWVTAVPALGGLPPDLPHLALSQAAALGSRSSVRPYPPRGQASLAFPSLGVVRMLEKACPSLCSQTPSASPTGSPVPHQQDLAEPLLPPRVLPCP